MRLALIGKGIQHSKSPEIYRDLLNRSCHYELIDLDLEELDLNLRHIFDRYQLDGLSVTAPFKQSFIDQIVNRNHLGVVNAVTKSSDGKNFLGVNTDLEAIKIIFPKIISEFGDREVLLLGDGAMAQTLHKIDGIKISKILSRKRNNLDQNEIETHLSQKIVINTCARSFDFPIVHAQHFLFWDFNYEHSKNKNHVELSNGRYIDGEEMLALQARFSLRFFQNKTL